MTTEYNAPKDAPITIAYTIPATPPSPPPKPGFFSWLIVLTPYIIAGWYIYSLIKG